MEMLRILRSGGFVTFLVASCPNQGLAQDFCELARSTFNGRPPLYSPYLAQLTNGGGWSFVPAATGRTHPTNGTANIVYFFRSETAGAKIVKVRLSKMQDEPAARQIILRRKNAIERCSTVEAGIQSFSVFFNLLADYENRGVPVNSEEYANYHFTGNDLLSPRLRDYHLSYRDRRGRCVRTDAKRENGEEPNRAQFLFGTRVYDSGLIAERLYIGRPAFGAVDPKRPIEKELELYRSHVQLETNLFVYQENQVNCVAFPIRHQGLRSATVTINDLEERASTGKRKERPFTVRLSTAE